MAEARAMPDLPIKRLDTETEIRRLHELLPTLGNEEVIAVYFRFWESLLIEDVANILGRTWSYTDKLIEHSLAKLRQGLTEPPATPQAAVA